MAKGRVRVDGMLQNATCEAKYITDCPTCGRSQVLVRCTAQATRRYYDFRCCRDCHPTEGTRAAVFGRELTQEQG